uniref:PsaJ n=1 Tax=Arundo donax TaxID=35708 RepID=A0A0A8Y3X6_ARUDO
MTLRFNLIHLFFLFASYTKKGFKENFCHVTKNSISRIGITRMKKKGNDKASGNKRLISINKPAKAPNHRVLSTGATERYVFISRIENPPSLLEYIYDQILLPVCISFV